MGFWKYVALGINEGITEKTNSDSSSSNPVDMKVAKFKLMYQRVAAYFGMKLTAIYVFPIGQYTDMYFHSLEEYLINESSVVYDTKWFNNKEMPLNQYIQSIKIYGSEDTWNREEGWSILFWHLLLLAVDDEAYNNELGNVMDVAYNLHFTEPMIRDWCRAVEYVLDGNELKEECDLQCETEEGKRFFLHQE